MEFRVLAYKIGIAKPVIDETTSDENFQETEEDHSWAEYVGHLVIRGMTEATFVKVRKPGQ